MKILYGINATGNGHLSRARVIISKLKERDHIVECVLSGRNDDKLYDLNDFKPYIIKKGFTFSKSNGRINYIKTFLKIDLIQFVKDILSIKKKYDLVITDFEPVSAYYSKIQKTPCFGIGHQYSFYLKIPMTFKMRITKIFFPFIYTPIKNVIASHFTHFDQPILPPFISDRVKKSSSKANSSKNILVYLPWENVERMILIFNQIKSHQFDYYCNIEEEKNINNITLKPFSDNGFKKDLVQNKFLITNSGFQLPAEALHIGKIILCKPLNGQPEQEHNAKILNDLNYATIAKNIDIDTINNWIRNGKKIKIDFPDPTELIIRIIENKNGNFKKEIDEIWQIK